MFSITVECDKCEENFPCKIKERFLFLVPVLKWKDFENRL